MRDEVTYEWLFEETEINEDGEKEIVDHNHADSLRDLADILKSGVAGDLSLVRETGNFDDGMTSRQWAYVDGSELPAFFDEGAKVPKRFFNELSKFNSKK